MDCSLRASLSMEFCRQDYWSGLSLPFPGDLPDPGIEPTSPALVGGFFITKPQGSPIGMLIFLKSIIFPDFQNPINIYNS